MSDPLDARRWGGVIINSIRFILQILNFKARALIFCTHANYIILRYFIFVSNVKTQSSSALGGYKFYSKVSIFLILYFKAKSLKLYTQAWYKPSRFAISSKLLNMTYDECMVCLNIRYLYNQVPKMEDCRPYLFCSSK